MRKKFNRYPALLLALLGASALFVSLTAAAPFALPPGPGDVEPLPEINPFARPPHAMRVAAPQLLSATAPITLPDPAWRIGITGDGLYRLTYAALEAAGVPTGTPPSAYHLSWRGQDIALEELGDALLFYAEKFHGSTQDEKYTGENVVWLTVDAATPGLRMTTRDVPPGGGAPLEWLTATARTEENLKYWARHSSTPGTDATWFWERVNTPTTVTYTYPLTLTAPVTQGYTATLVVEVASYNYNNSVNPDHHLRVALNDVVAGETFWDGRTGHIFTVTVPAVALQDGVNDLQVAYLTDVGHQTVYFDRATLTYRRQPIASAGALAWDAPLSGTLAVTLTGLTAGARPYDVSAPLRPIALTGYATTTAGSVLTFTWRDTATLGTAYRVETPRLITPTLVHPPTDLLSPTIGADEIIIAPRAFCDAVEPLAERRRTQGLRVKVVAVEDVYNLFNGGVVHPEAIRAFVAYAHAHWPTPAPRYLLLAGDGHFNPKDYNPAVYGEFVPVWIPPYLEFADPDQGEVPVDSRFGDVDGDGFPELAVGRLPVNSAEELAGVVQKLLDYEDAPFAPWMGRALFVADDGSTYPEGFANTLDRLQTDFISPTVTTRTVYIQDYCPKTALSTTAEWYADCPSATLALTQTWSAGAALLTYSGHGSIHRWAHEPLLVNTQLPTLQPTDGMPFLISLDCWDGYWMFPPQYPVSGGTGDVRSIGEWATTALTDSGTIATFGPAGLGYLYIEEPLAQAMFDALFNHGVRSLGELTQAGRQAVSGSYLARTYTLLGDPALQLRLVEIQRVYLPLVLRQ